MQIEFQVIRDGAVVFKRDFAEASGSQVADLTAMALHDLRNRRPDISLFDEDVILKWETKE